MEHGAEVFKISFRCCRQEFIHFYAQSFGPRSINDDIADGQDFHKHSMLLIFILRYALQSFRVNAENFVIIEELLIVDCNSHRAGILRATRFEDLFAVKKDIIHCVGFSVA